MIETWTFDQYPFFLLFQNTKTPLIEIVILDHFMCPKVNWTILPSIGAIFDFLAIGYCKFRLHLEGRIKLD